MRIPIVGIPEAPGPERSFTPVSTTTFDKVGEAGRELGGAIEGLGGLASRIKGAIDEGTLAKAQTSAQAQFQAFSDSLQDGKNPQNGDPSTYMERWQAARQGFVEQLTADHGVTSLSPNARIRFQTELDRWTQESDMRVGHLATIKALQNTAGDLNTQYEQSLINGDQDGARRAMETGMRTGALNPEEAKQKIFQIPMRAEYNQAVKMMSRDPDTGGGPIVLEKALQEQNADGSFKFYPHVVGQQREALMFDAYRNARVIQAQTAEGYAAQQASGVQPDPNQVNKDLRLGKIGLSQAHALLRPGQLDPQVFAGLASRIENFDVKGDKDHVEEGKLWADLNAAQRSLSTTTSERLAKLFNEKLAGKSVYGAPPSFDTGAFSKLVGSIAEYDPTHDPNHAGEAQLWGAINGAKADLSPAATGRLNELFKQKLDPNSTFNTSAVKAVLDANKALFQHGGYGDFSYVRPPTKEEMAKDPEAKPKRVFLPNVQIKAEQARAAVDQKVFEFLEAHPEQKNDEQSIMAVFAQASQAQRGARGVGLFSPPTLTPTAP